MKIVRLLSFAGIAAASLATFAGVARAQGPLYDKVIVDLPYSVTLNDKTLPPGHYVIRQFESPSGSSRILQVYSENGMKLEGAAQTIPALDNNTPDKTSVVLHHFGQDYYFDLFRRNDLSTRDAISEPTLGGLKKDFIAW